jgi:flagellar basal body-associated protein FliL
MYEPPQRNPIKLAAALLFFIAGIAVMILVLSGQEEQARKDQPADPAPVDVQSPAGRAPEEADATAQSRSMLILLGLGLILLIPGFFFLRSWYLVGRGYSATWSQGTPADRFMDGW